MGLFNASAFVAKILVYLFHFDSAIVEVGINLSIHLGGSSYSFMIVVLLLFSLMPPWWIECIHWSSDELFHATTVIVECNALYQMLVLQRCKPESNCRDMTNKWALLMMIDSRIRESFFFRKWEECHPIDWERNRWSIDSRASRIA